MWGGSQPTPHNRLLVPSPVVALPPPPRQQRLRLSPSATRASRSSSGVLAGGGGTRYQPQTRLVAAQEQSMPPPPAASAVRRDAQTGLAFLLFVLAVKLNTFLKSSGVVAEYMSPTQRQALIVDEGISREQFNSYRSRKEFLCSKRGLSLFRQVMSSFLSLAIFSFPARRAMQQLETAAHKLSKVVAEEVPGTLSSLKLSFMEINDLTSQLKNLRQRLAISRFGEKTSAEARSQTG